MSNLEQTVWRLQNLESSKFEELKILESPKFGELNILESSKFGEEANDGEKGA